MKSERKLNFFQFPSVYYHDQQQQQQRQQQQQQERRCNTLNKPSSFVFFAAAAAAAALLQPQEKQQHVMRSLFAAVSRRPDDGCCCFTEDIELFGPNHRIIYRHFATLYFIFVTDHLESELGILDLIQVLDACFENVCELDLVFHYDKINYILDEIIVGGLVMETAVETILESVSAVKKLVDSETSFFA
ncbi:adaptor-related protein complex 3, sigma 2 subunit, putative [Eimeria brunetti]|uniref:Adaptor-related protein complex 3, sigma 2 subunit, putative n=1 Tax=Eimeria brunetti TaxID=51314 RepID=U6LM04_9EIME|nr:adaptor-related protein complex 3, sigma 2 subunit, putative [Eimeria brunetti]